MRAARSDMNLEDLARRMSALEEESFYEFAGFFGPRFRALFLSRGLTRADAEELSVSCVTDISLKVGQYKPVADGSFEAWVFTLARRYVIDWWRARQPSLPLPDDLPLSTPSVEEPEPDSELVVAVRAALAQLSEADQKLIRLRNMEGEYTYAEAGEALGISAGTARVRHFRALKRLESLLMKDQRITRHLDRRNVPGKEESNE